jgi:hypothetical protein
MSASFVAQIDLLATDAGGRAGRLSYGEWRTVLGINREHWSTRLLFTGEPSPGEAFEAEVRLLIPDAKQYFPVGAVFTVWEGGKKGLGQVISTSA